MNLKIFMLIIFVLTMLSFWFTESRYTTRVIKTKPFLPEAVRKRGQKILTNIRIPNTKFCDKMQLASEQLYMAMPWWYQYCQDLKERKAKRHGYTIDVPVIKGVIEHVNKYRKTGRF
ncbi:hypothetical protein K1T71_006520 [Dendrolimus kikuchii]|uniref:Uncharacterized protein n=1 Tax=Dendrolimus kikuchii TaxID=765133 RepID=A0ACC1D1D3_9NEOP|nr:hypothetical protein K1T71_006520 [Dendrolimus kikuchii]